jgi:hypothetical protein
MELRRTKSAAAPGVAALLVAVLCVEAAAAVKLKPASQETFQRYVRLTDARVQGEVASAAGFLWPDFLPAEKKQAAYARLRNGEVVIEALEILENGKKIEDADSLIHHWVGMVFIPGAQRDAVLAVIQAYDRHAEIYKPDVMRSKILEHNGSSFRTQVRFFKKKVLTAVVDTDHEIRYFPLDTGPSGSAQGLRRVHSRTWTTRVQQVQNHDKKNEKLLPPGDDDGYLWQLYTWWRFEERDGGVYVQCESVTLTRDVPAGLGWLVGPFVKSIPRDSIQFTLDTTRKAVLYRRPPAGEVR